MKISEKTIKTATGEWFYRETLPETETRSAPLILLHGLPSHSYTWREMMPMLSQQGLRVIAPDWLGFGKSDKPSRREFAYTPASYVKAFSELVDAWEIEQLSLVVQGFLGSVGIQYALQNPQRIQKLIILNTPLCKSVKLPWKMQQWGIPLMGEMMTQDPLLVDRTLEAGSGFVISDSDLAVHRQPFLKSSAVGRALTSSIRQLNLSAAMAEIETGLSLWELPTLIIWGMADPWLVAETPKALAQNRPNIQIVALPEAKHYPQEHWPKEIAQKINQFFSE